MTKELLGYIRFKYDKNGDGYGHVEITNFGASLEYNHLKIGATTKGDQTGQHGIGLKVAALAFLRSPNHQSFRIECSLGRWVFIINSEFELCCKTEHITPEYIEQAEKMKDSSTLGSNPSTDVSVYIGHLGRGIHVDAFRKWLDVVRDTYTLGGKIDHNDPDWGGKFPGSHEYYRTSVNDVYIVKPKRPELEEKAN